MKKLILGLDGMDFDIAVDLNLTNVLQVQFGRIVVPINDVVGRPRSPEVWGSFLCGEHVKKVFEGRKVWLLKYLVKLKRMFPFISLGLGKKASGKIVGFPELDKETWVDLPNVKEVNSPYYSYTNEAFEYTNQFGEDKDLDKFQNSISDLYERDTKKIISAVKSEIEHPECDILFAYLHFPDLFSHIWYQDKDKLFSLHLNIDDFVGTILKMLTKDIHVIIISDHGFDFKVNDHSDLGFISSNKFMNFPKDIMGLGKLMYEYAGASK